jgi:hypothetical protein
LLGAHQLKKVLNAMLKDYWKYEWVLPVCRYEGLESLLAALAEKGIAPSQAKMRALAEQRRMIEAELTKPLVRGQVPRRFTPKQFAAEFAFKGLDGAGQGRLCHVAALSPNEVAGRSIAIAKLLWTIQNIVVETLDWPASRPTD